MTELTEFAAWWPSQQSFVEVQATQKFITERLVERHELLNTADKRVAQAPTVQFLIEHLSIALVEIEKMRKEIREIKHARTFPQGGE